MRNSLTIAVTQPACRSYDVVANAREHAATVLAARARLVVFPELSLTGYELDAPTITADDPRLAPIVEACAATGSIALVGAPVPGEAEGSEAAGADGSRARPAPSHIALLAVDGKGAAVAYRKMWLGPAESERFTPGPTPAVLEVDGWRLGLAICKDTGIARHAAGTVALGIDVYVASVLHSADELDVQDERARRIAVRDRVWVAVASFAGATGGGYAHACGHSGIWAPGGAGLARSGPEIGAIARASLPATAGPRPQPGPGSAPVQR